MKGALHKAETGWQVLHATYDTTLKHWNTVKYPLHPDDVKQIEEDSKVFDNIEARIAAYPVVVFEIIEVVSEKVGDNMWVNTYAKLINIDKLGNDEISDEEIEKAAIEYADKMYDKKVLDDEWEVVKYDFMEACKWYREQLKQRK